MRRLTILLAAVGALMLVPAASAFANGTMKVLIAGEGSGEVSSAAGNFSGKYKGIPPIECAYDGNTETQSGVCEDEVSLEGGIESTYLTAIPAPGTEFVGWVVEKGGIINQHCEFPEEMSCAPADFEDTNNEYEVIAFFEEEPGFPLTLNIEEGSGTVVSSPSGLECSGAAPKTCNKNFEGKVTLTASPAPGYLVKSWKGCDAGGVNGRQCTVTVSSAKTVGVKFYKVFSLAGSKTGGLGIMGTAPGGINCGYACTSSSALYKEGGLTVKAKPAKHFHFVEFTGGTGSAESCNGVTSESCTIASFNSNSAIEEVYAEDAKHTLDLTKEGGGQGFIKTKPTNINCGLTCTAAEAEFFASESPEVTVTLGKGTSKVTWTNPAGTCTGNALSCTVPMTGDFELVAKFD